MKKRTKIIITCVCLYMVFIGIPLCIWGVDRQIKMRKELAHLEVFEDEAIDYAENLELGKGHPFKVYKRVWSYTEEYAEKGNFFITPDVPEDIDEFEKNLKKLEVYIKVSNHKYCVTFEQTDSGSLEIVDLQRVND